MLRINTERSRKLKHQPSLSSSEKFLMTKYLYKSRLTVSRSRADGDNYHREKRRVSPKATHLARDGADADVGGGGWWWLAGFKGASTSYVEKEARTYDREGKG